MAILDFRIHINTENCNKIQTLKRKLVLMKWNKQAYTFNILMYHLIFWLLQFPVEIKEKTF